MADPSPKVGFYGCNVIDRIVRVGLVGDVPNHRMYPKHALVDCPCENQHIAKITWRLLQSGEQVAPEVWVERASKEDMPVAKLS